MSRLPQAVLVSLALWSGLGWGASFHVLDFFQIARKDKHPEWLDHARAVGAYSNPRTGRASGIFVSPHFFLTTYEAVEQIGCEKATIQTGLIAENPTKQWDEYFSTPCLDIAAQDKKLKVALLQVTRAAPHPLRITAESFSTLSTEFRLMGYVEDSYLAISEKCTQTTRALNGNCTATTCCGRQGSCQADDTIWAGDCFAEAGMNGAAAVVEQQGQFFLLGLHHARLQQGNYLDPQGRPVQIGGGWRPPAVFASTYDFPSKMPDAWKLIEEDWQEFEQRGRK